MKNKLIMLLVLTMLATTAIIGCSAKDKVEKALNSSTTSEQKDSKHSGNVQKELSDRAKTEGVSVAEMEKMIAELTKLTAEKYGDTYENYVATLESQGKTPFGEFATAADYMEITIKEYYEYEKNKPELSAQDKETMEGMQNALKELEGIDVSTLEQQANALQENAEQMQNAEKKETNGNVIELAQFEVHEVNKEENDKGIGHYGIEYTSKREASDVVAHFKEFLAGTDNYYIMDSSPAAAVISGTVNGTAFDVALERDFENDLTYITVFYNGKIEE